MVSELGNH